MLVAGFPVSPWPLARSTSSIPLRAHHVDAPSCSPVLKGESAEETWRLQDKRTLKPGISTLYLEEYLPQVSARDISPMHTWESISKRGTFIAWKGPNDLEDGELSDDVTPSDISSLALASDSDSDDTIAAGDVQADSEGCGARGEASQSACRQNDYRKD